MRLKKLSFLLFFCFFLLIIPQKVFAQVVINEFFSGTTSDWVELYNKGAGTVSLANYRIRDSDSNKKDLSGDLPAGGILMTTFSNYLNNSGDIVKLLKVAGETEELLEEIPYGSEGGICAPGESGSIGRFIDGNLPFIRFAASSPGSSNNLSQEDPCPTPTPTPTLTLTPTQIPPTPTPTTTPKPTAAPASYSNIYISEFMANPEGESEDEWVELYNDNDFEVNLNGWYLDDVFDGGGPPKPISDTIASKSYKQFYLVGIGDSFFNNDGDEVRLLDGSSNQKDAKTYSYTTEGRTWSKDSQGRWCEQVPTPNSANPDCSSPTPTPTATPTLTKTPTPTRNLTLTLTPTGEQYEFELQTLESSPQVLGTQVSPSEAPVISGQDRFKITSGLFILAGLILLGFSVFFVLKERFVRQENLY